ncbi:MAG: hypothetical protein AAGC60_24805 [Acidobacteriota bacterium]
MKAIATLTRPAGALLVAAALAFGVFALMPGDLDARERCFCPPATQIAHGWGMAAASCAAAKASCEADANSKANNTCWQQEGTSVCAYGSIQFFPANCYFDSGMWKVDCDKEFACEFCIEIPDGP